MTKHCVWYRLVGEQGSAFKKTTVDFVTISPFTTVVAQFCDAVYAKNAGILAGIESQQLAVHEETPQNGEIKLQSVSEDKIVGRLGKTKKKALVVVVPTSVATLALTDSPHSVEETTSNESSSPDIENRNNEPTPAEPTPADSPQAWATAILQRMCCCCKK